jgi:hypothetical protein
MREDNNNYFSLHTAKVAIIFKKVIFSQPYLSSLSLSYFKNVSEAVKT